MDLYTCSAHLVLAACPLCSGCIAAYEGALSLDVGLWVYSEGPIRGISLDDGETVGR